MRFLLEIVVAGYAVPKIPTVGRSGWGLETRTQEIGLLS